MQGNRQSPISSRPTVRQFWAKSPDGARPNFVQATESGPGVLGLSARRKYSVQCCRGVSTPIQHVSPWYGFVVCILRNAIISFQHPSFLGAIIHPLVSQAASASQLKPWHDWGPTAF